ncbi:MAG: hypothetical protein HYR72_16250 [Deltaproteobacteria bacterium]|nr:hypothetical protein [Deltaproteobacteria bacterium]MBI3389582.1 hypothetical protein [Deltaproteobacteria bacterium]
MGNFELASGYQDTPAPSIILANPLVRNLHLRVLLYVPRFFGQKFEAQCLCCSLEAGFKELTKAGQR